MSKTIIGRLTEISFHTPDNNVLPLVLSYLTFLRYWPSEVIINNMKKTIVIEEEVSHESS